MPSVDMAIDPIILGTMSTDLVNVMDMAVLRGRGTIDIAIVVTIPDSRKMIAYTGDMVLLGVEGAIVITMAPMNTTFIINIAKH